MIPTIAKLRGGSFARVLAPVKAGDVHDGKGSLMAVTELENHELAESVRE